MQAGEGQRGLVRASWVENTDVGMVRLITAWWTATKPTASRNGTHIW